VQLRCRTPDIRVNTGDVCSLWQLQSALKRPFLARFSFFLNRAAYLKLLRFGQPNRKTTASPKANPFKYAKSGTGGFAMAMEYIKDKIELYGSGGKQGQLPQDLMDVRKARYNAPVSGGGGASSSSA
jgi:hypothetical protein